MKRSKKQKKVSTLRELWRYISRDRLKLIVSLLLSFIAAICTLITPAISGRAIDKLIGTGLVEFDGLIKIILLLASIYLVSFLSSFLISMLMARVASGTVHILRKKAFETLMTLPVSYFDSTPHGDIISRLTNDIDAVYEGLYGLGNVIIAGVISLVGSLGFMIYLNPKISLIVVVMTPVAAVTAGFIAKGSGKYFMRQSKKTGELNGFSEETINGLQTIKAYGGEAAAEERFAAINAELYQAGQHAQFYSALVNPTMRIVNNITYILVGVVGALAALAGGLTIGGISAFLSYATQFARPINEISAVATQLGAAFASARRIFELIGETPESDDSALPELKVKNGAVSFRNVSFSYEPSHELIKKLELEIKPDSLVAIVGPTGAGKTTLVNLLMRFYDVTGGEILIDGMPINNVTRESLRRSISMVLQETYIFHGTIFDNIAYGKEGATREEVIAAAKNAGAHSFIKRLSNGYDTVIGEGAGGLSYGQMQLLTIARAMLSEGDILILDEATSSVDTLTEIRIQEAFKRMMDGKTCFVIAHRLSTIRHADLILVMENGDIVEKGTHRELLKLGGVYSREAAR